MLEYVSDSGKGLTHDPGAYIRPSCQITVTLAAISYFILDIINSRKRSLSFGKYITYKSVSLNINIDNVCYIVGIMNILMLLNLNKISDVL